MEQVVWTKKIEKMTQIVVQNNEIILIDRYTHYSTVPILKNCSAVMTYMNNRYIGMAKSVWGPADIKLVVDHQCNHMFLRVDCAEHQIQK